jgi:hypothetical protein
MTTKGRHRIGVAGFILAACLAPLAALVLTPDSATSTTDLMSTLPAYQKYKCALCHTSATPIAGSSALNRFGRDFLANEKVWDRTLALLNSDEDKCLNGFELGDQDGDGVFDYPGQVIEHSNPGDGADCSIALSKQTWGTIKEIFRSEIPDYLEGEDLRSGDPSRDVWSPHFP